jgi:beta-glucosidase
MNCKIGLICIVQLLSYSAFAQNKDIYKQGWIDFNKNGVQDIFENPSVSIDERAEDLLSRMTLEEKTCQLATLYGSGRVLEDAGPTPKWKTEIWKDGIGNIDEQANGLGKFGSKISFPYAKG